MALLQCNFFSEAIKIHTSMNVILPEGGSGRDIPTLYLLHGYSDSFMAWTRWTSIERYAREYRVAVVMPDCQKSFYNDFPGIESGYRYWTFVTGELLDASRRFFRLSPRRGDTFVAGLSMGGFGAFKCALNRPDVFAAAASLSGALDLSAANPVRAGIGINECNMVLGGLDDVPGGANDLFAAAEKTAKLAEKPRLFQYCGTDDSLYGDNVRFRNFVRELGYDYTYEESPGGHEWELWDRYVKRVLEWLSLEKA